MPIILLFFLGYLGGLFLIWVGIKAISVKRFELYSRGLKLGVVTGKKAKICGVLTTVIGLVIVFSVTMLVNPELMATLNLSWSILIWVNLIVIFCSYICIILICGLQK